MQLVTGKPLTGRKRTCDCGRPACVVKWGDTAVCQLCHKFETQLYTLGSKWDPAFRKQRVET